MQSKTVRVNIQFLKIYIKERGLSEKEFAELIGVDHSTVNRVLNGKRNPGNKFIAGVLRNCNLTFEQVFSCDNTLPKSSEIA